MKGTEPKALSTTQNKTTNKKPSLAFISFWEFILGKYKIEPEIKNNIKEVINILMFPSLKINDVITGMMSATLNNINIVPRILCIRG
jgi:hypothetical protein